MRTIYIDSNKHCHVINVDEAMTPVETDFFDDKCDTFVEGYCIDTDNGMIIYPWKSYWELNIAQQRYEKQLLINYKNKEEELNTSYQDGVNSI